MSCLYTDPILRPPENALPRVLVPSGPEPEEGYPVSLRREVNSIFVAATDPDRDELDVIWELGTFDVTELETDRDQGETRTTFLIRLPRDPEFHDEVLVATILDPLSEVSVRFRLEVP